MNYTALLDMVTELSYRLAMSGAETYRIEECVNSITKAYGVNAEAFSIPNCLHISITTDHGEPLTRMRRIGYHGNDLDSVEKFSNLSRRICQETPDPIVAMKWIEETENSRRSYTFPFYILGNFLGGAGFSVLFGAKSVSDWLLAGVCGMIIGLINSLMEKQKANQFFRIVIAVFCMAIFAYLLGYLKLASNTNAITIGALMILVPGLLFTNAMRDVIYGDTNSGINRIVHVLLIAVSIAIGTAAAWNLIAIFQVPVSAQDFVHPLWIEIPACFIACIGFFVLFNIHGFGGFLCALGGTLTWVCYRLTASFGGSTLLAYFFATLVAAIYSEVMARIRKYPAISYLVISIFPLIPGAGVYYAMLHAVNGETAKFAAKGIETASIAGTMAAGILLASTVARIISTKRQKRIPG